MAQACRKAHKCFIQGTQVIFFLPAWNKDLLSQGHILPLHLSWLIAESEGGGHDIKWTDMDVRCSRDVYSTFCPGFPKWLLCCRNNVGWAPSSTLHQRWHKALQVHRSWLVTEIQHHCHCDFYSSEELSSKGKFSKLLHSKGTKFGGYFFHYSCRKFQEVAASGCSYLHSAFCHLSAFPFKCYY